MNRLVSAAIFIASLALAGIAGVQVYDRIHPGPAPPGVAKADAARLGRSYAPALSEAYAAAWEKAAAGIEAGGDMAKAQADQQAAFQAARKASFLSIAAPSFAGIIAEGAEPRDAAQRAEVVKFCRDFARGMRGGK